MARRSQVGASEEGGHAAGSADEACLTMSVDAGVALITFNQPTTANAWSLELQLAYSSALRACAADDGVRAVVITGAGRHFCVGGDMSLLDQIRNGAQPAIELRPQSFLSVIDFPKPLIAAINGAAAGMGLIHTLLCDVRFAAEDAVLTTSFARLGLIAEHAASWLLPQIVGRGHALDMLLSSRPVRAPEAARIGLVHRCVAPEQVVAEALAYAKSVADAGCNDVGSIKQDLTDPRRAVIGAPDAGRGAR